MSVRYPPKIVPVDVIEPCDCGEPDGMCEGCDDEHGHTCIVCGYDFCRECWNTERHEEQPCPRGAREAALA